MFLIFITPLRLYMRAVYIMVSGGAGFDPAERTIDWTVDPLNLIQVMLAEGPET